MTFVAGAAGNSLMNNISSAWCGSHFANTDSWNVLPGHLKELFRLSMEGSHYHRLHWPGGGKAACRTGGTDTYLDTG